MRTTHKTFLTGLAAALALGLAAPAFADHGRHRGWDRDDEHYKQHKHHGHHGHHWERQEQRHVHIHEYRHDVYVEPAYDYGYAPPPPRPYAVISVPPIVVKF